MAVGDENEGIRDDAVVPADHALVEAAPRVAASEEDRKPGGDNREEHTTWSNHKTT